MILSCVDHSPNPGSCQAVFFHCLDPGDPGLFCHVGACPVSLPARDLIFRGQASWLNIAPPLLPCGVQQVLVVFLVTNGQGQRGGSGAAMRMKAYYF